jgi:hypothetical protein
MLESHGFLPAHSTQKGQLGLSQATLSALLFLALLQGANRKLPGGRGSRKTQHFSDLGVMGPNW